MGTGGPAPDGAAGAEAEPAATKARYLSLLERLDDVLIGTQITDPSSSDFGALVSPSTNPDPHPTHSRAAEAVYPLAVAYKHGQNEKYKNAAIALGNWLITLQQSSGAWGEEWPNHDGWDATTSDQLISLAGAYVILGPELSSSERAAWAKSITNAADWIQSHFPKGVTNYTPTGAVALVFAHRAVPNPKPSWLEKATTLIDLTLSKINSENFLTGEGASSDVDLGYNIAQSIGFLALYGLLADAPAVSNKAEDLLKTHRHFMYPNGAIDNSWGSRSYKWTLESGSKTAPGVYLAFGLLADRDPSFQRGAGLALSYLQEHALSEEGWVVYGPHAFRHPSSNPPSNYSTFARAQSIATVIEFGPEALAVAPIPTEGKDQFQYFASVETGVLRSDKIVATLTAYDADQKYPRDVAVRGGSATLVWFEGYGDSGFLQASSQTNYQRLEAQHMPVESNLLPLTPRIETTSGSYATNLFDDQASLTIAKVDGAIEATSSGTLRTLSGASSGITFTWKHRFNADSYSKQVTLSKTDNVRIVEPFVDNPGNQYTLSGDKLEIETEKGGVWSVKLETAGAGDVSAGQDRSRYYCPFPGLDAYPFVIQLGKASPKTLEYSVRQVSANVR